VTYEFPTQCVKLRASGTILYALNRSAECEFLYASRTNGRRRPNEGCRILCGQASSKNCKPHCLNGRRKKSTTDWLQPGSRQSAAAVRWAPELEPRPQRPAGRPGTLRLDGQQKRSAQERSHAIGFCARRAEARATLRLVPFGRSRDAMTRHSARRNATRSNICCSRSAKISGFRKPALV
jgi:hypothetical protein